VGVTILKHLRNASLIAFGTLLALEIALRTVGMADPVLYVSDASCGYRHKPEQRIRFLGNTIAINRLGLRDARGFESKREGISRVLVLGDSVAWGGVTLRDDKLFASLLERGLLETEVVNAGVNGYSIQQMVALYESRLKVLAPDVIVVYCIIGDFLRPPITDLAGNSAAFPTKGPWLAIGRSLAIARTQIAAKTGWAWPRPYIATVSRDGDHPMEERIAANCEALVRLRDAMTPEQRLLVVMSPQIQNAVDTETSGRILNLLREQKFDIIDLQNEVAPIPAMFVDGTHLSAQGHAWVAERLQAKLSILADHPAPAPNHMNSVVNDTREAIRPASH